MTEVCWLSSHLLLFSKEKICLKKEGSYPRSSKPATQQIHRQVHFVHLYGLHVYCALVDLHFFQLSRCLVPTPGLTTKYPISVIWHGEGFHRLWDHSIQEILPSLRTLPMRLNELWTCPDDEAARAQVPGCQRSSCGSVRRGRGWDQYNQQRT